MPTFFSRFTADRSSAMAHALEDLPAAIYRPDLDAPVWGAVRDLTAEQASISTRSGLPRHGVARIVIHGPAAPVCVDATTAWDRYDDGERAIVTGFRFVRTTRAGRRGIDALAATAARSIAATLSGPLRAEIEAEDSLALAPLVRRRRIRPGRVIFSRSTHDGRGDSLFVVEQGRISLHLVGIGSRRKELRHVEEGELFGSIAASLGPVHELAVAETEARLLELERSSLDRIGDRRPGLALRLASVASRAASLRYRESLLAAPTPDGVWREAASSPEASSSAPNAER